MPKLTPTVKAQINKLAAQGVSGREIAKRVGRSNAAVAAHLAAKRGAGKATEQAPVEAPPPAAPQSDKTAPASREEIRGVLSGQLSVLGTLEAQQRASGEDAAAATTRRQIVQVSTVLAKLTRDESEDETGVVKVRLSEVESAAQKAREKLRDLVAREVARRVGG